MCVVICCFQWKKSKTKGNILRTAFQRKKGLAQESVREESILRWGSAITSLSATVSCLQLTPFVAALCEQPALCEVVCIWYIFFVCNRHFVLRRTTERSEPIKTKGKKVSSEGPVARTAISFGSSASGQSSDWPHGIIRGRDRSVRLVYVKFYK